MVMASVVTAERRDTVLLGGISSSFRINQFTGRYLETDSVEGPYIHTKDGRTYIDFFMCHGASILGHAHPAVRDAMCAALDRYGVVAGYETGLGEEVAEHLARMIPAIERVRYAASGSEAVYMTIRLARAATGRELVVKIDGHFNGGSDYALLNAFARATDDTNTGGHLSAARPISAGIPTPVRESMLLVPLNDLVALEKAFADNPGQIAAIIMNPIDFNNGCIVASDGFMTAAKDLAHRHGALFILDEVLSGFKTGTSCAQGYFGVTPDLTTLSKALANGVPMSVIGGRADLLEYFTFPIPRGALQGGTYAGNMLGVSAAKATLDIIDAPGFYPDLLARAEYFYGELQKMFDRSPTPAIVQHVGCGFGIYVGTREPVRSYADIRKLDPADAQRFFGRAIDRDVYFHTDFTVSHAHTRAVLDEALSRIESAAAAQ
jgi:glutamate-1-semialdehyde 2,1-aminomutase